MTKLKISYSSTRKIYLTSQITCTVRMSLNAESSGNQIVLIMFNSTKFSTLGQNNFESGCKLRCHFVM